MAVCVDSHESAKGLLRLPDGYRVAKVSREWIVEVVMFDFLGPCKSFLDDDECVKVDYQAGVCVWRVSSACGDGSTYCQVTETAQDLGID